MGSADIIITVIAIALAIALFVWFVVIKQVPAAKKIALALVIEAEAKYGSGTGEIKYAEVVGKIYGLLPWTLKLFVTEKFINNLIEGAVTYMKNYLGETEIQKAAISL